MRQTVRKTQEASKVKVTGKKEAHLFDVAEYLASDEAVEAYLRAALEDGDPQLVAAALGDVARAKGMTQLARETGVTRDGLYKALSPAGNPSFATVQKVVNALGYRLDVVASA